MDKSLIKKLDIFTAQTIITARDKKKLSIKEVSQLTGIPVRVLQMYERSTRSAKVDDFIKLSQVLGINIYKFLNKFSSIHKMYDRRSP